MRRILLITASAMALTVGAGLGTASAGQNQQSAYDQGAGQPNAGARDSVMHAQQALQQQGFYRGKVDGIDGPQTRQALQQFQKRNGLQVTGSLDQQTMDRLNGNAQGASGATNSGASGSGDNTGIGGRIRSMLPQQQPQGPAHGAWQNNNNNADTQSHYGGMTH